MSRAFHLYCFGSNGSGQLGLEHLEDVSIPTRCLLQNSEELDVPLKIAAGGNHTLVLFASGSVYSVGENRDGRCSTLQSTGFNRVLFNSVRRGKIDSFKLCSATWEASIFVTPESRVYTCGAGSKGELGLGENVTTVNMPESIEDFPPMGTSIVDVASSMWHTVAVLSNGEAYGWGNGRKGQLGKSAAIAWSPRRIDGLTFKAVRACCGREFTYLVGEPSTGQHAILGSDKWLVKSAAPESVPGWRDIGASWGSIYVLLQDGTVLSWGRNDHGQLGPSQVPPLSSIAVGSEHALGVTLDQKLIAWGWGEHGNCGGHTDDAGDVKGRWNEISFVQDTTASSPEVKFVGAGCATSWVCCEES